MAREVPDAAQIDAVIALAMAAERALYAHRGAPSYSGGSRLGRMSSPDDRKPGTGTMLLSRETLAQTGLSVVLSAAVAFGVASYTANRADESQRRDAARAEESQRREASRARLSAVYLPLGKAVSGVVACVSTRFCSESQLFRANRDYNRSALLAYGQGSEAVSDATSALDATLRVVVRNRFDGKRQPDALLRRAGQQVADLQQLIVRELSK